MHWIGLWLRSAVSKAGNRNTQKELVEEMKAGAGCWTELTRDVQKSQEGKSYRWIRRCSSLETHRESSTFHLNEYIANGIPKQDPLNTKLFNKIKCIR